MSREGERRHAKARAPKPSVLIFGEGAEQEDRERGGPDVCGPKGRGGGASATLRAGDPAFQPRPPAVQSGEGHEARGRDPAALGQARQAACGKLRVQLLGRALAAARLDELLRPTQAGAL
ncbi:MAG: hypothetical protein Q4E05_02870 [Pseudoclavibacter sp.]|nr:hypothetical protein [Pseudoclavibacter sp.]